MAVRDSERPERLVIRVVVSLRNADRNLRLRRRNNRNRNRNRTRNRKRNRNRSRHHDFNVLKYAALTRCRMVVPPSKHLCYGSTLYVDWFYSRILLTEFLAAKDNTSHDDASSFPSNQPSLSMLLMPPRRKLVFICLCQYKTHYS